MAGSIGTPAYLRNRAHVGSVDLRLADRWGCQIGTAKSRRERSLRETLDVMEAYLALGDSAALGHIVTLFDAVLAGQPQLPKLDAVYLSDKADLAEDEAALEYRRCPSKQTARAWLDALGREGRANEPLMACLREDWSL